MRTAGGGFRYDPSQMHVLITGGAGFLGKALAAQLLARGRLVAAGGRDERIDQITLTDIVTAQGVGDPRVTQFINGEAGERLMEMREAQLAEVSEWE